MMVCHSRQCSLVVVKFKMMDYTVSPLITDLLRVVLADNTLFREEVQAR